jgi:hypothetical protein
MVGIFFEYNKIPVIELTKTALKLISIILHFIFGLSYRFLRKQGRRHRQRAEAAITSPPT